MTATRLDHHATNNSLGWNLERILMSRTLPKELQRALERPVSVARGLFLWVAREARPMGQIEGRHWQRGVDRYRIAAVRNVGGA